MVETKGIPLALYVDRHGIFERSRRTPLSMEEELAGGRLPTQVGRVLGELGIAHIAARSPQAKGRIERLWGTFQDRLVSELRLAGAQTRADANRVLWGWLPTFNTRFGVPAAQPGTAYRPLPPGFVADTVFCFKYMRVVALDNTLRFGPHRLQLRAGSHRVSYAKARVEVHERLDGSLAVYHHGVCVASQLAPPEAPLLRARTGARGTPPRPPVGAEPGRARRTRVSPATQQPAADHPWRRPLWPVRTNSLAT